jgi:signal transduction histidine kinase
VRWRELLADLVVGFAAFAVSVAVLQADRASGGDLRRVDMWAYVALAAYSGSVVLRRVTPAVAAVGGVSAGVVYAAAQYPPALTPVVLLSVYAAAARLQQRAARAVLAGTLALGAIGTTLGPGPTDLGVPAFILSSWLLGNYVAARRAYTAELEAKNRLLEQAQRDLADRAVAEERLRIARELHDVVAHTMSVVALHAGTGRMIAQDDPGAAQPALATIETATRSALAELRHMLGALRGPDAGESTPDLSPAPGLAALDALVAEVVEAGVHVEVRVEGTRMALPAGVDLSAYRIVQEALTNVIKHAGGARTTVVVRYAPDAVTVDVDNDGVPELPGTGAPRPGGAGHGLVGMRERVALYAGDFVADRRAGGGFHISARLPYSDAAT